MLPYDKEGIEYSVFPVEDQEYYEDPVRKLTLRRRAGARLPPMTDSPTAAERQVPELSYPEALPGYLNIGLLHTSLDGRPGHDDYAPCSLDDLRSKDYAYWALGHVHKRDEVLEAQYLTDPQWELVVRHILFFSERWRTADHRVRVDHGRGADEFVNGRGILSVIDFRDP